MISARHQLNVVREVLLLGYSMCSMRSVRGGFISRKRRPSGSLKVWHRGQLNLTYPMITLGPVPVTIELINFVMIRSTRVLCVLCAVIQWPDILICTESLHCF
jgi:hypothetical protein